MSFFISLALSFFKEFISPQALLYLAILGMLFWIKFNDLYHIGKWQVKHEKRSEVIWKTLTKHGEDIAGLKQGKADK